MSYSEFINNAYKSERLIYRAIEDNQEDTAWIAEFLLNDPAITIMGTPRLAHPAPLTSAKEYVNYNRGNLLNVLICLPPEVQDAATGGGSEGSNDKGSKTKPAPVGSISLVSPGPHAQHHRHATVSINIIAPYRGKGYGGEAINWALDWGFRRAGLHRISIGAFSYNSNALHLYRKLGFVEEGREREARLFDREWHDAVSFGMLEHEWAKLRGLA
jgi:GNAT superfamily N-acetyltransferase